MLLHRLMFTSGWRYVDETDRSFPAYVVQNKSLFFTVKQSEFVKFESFCLTLLI